jgi:heme exporter protein A
VFEGLNFEVKAGDFLSLTGKNGSGKSTFLRLIAGLIPESDGAISYSRGDETLNFLNNDDFTLVGHQNGLKPSMTLRENAQFYYKLMTGNRPAADRMQMAADIFALGSLLDEPAQYFSSGQRHRSALMRFPLVARQIWLMDEPTVGLDADNRAALAALIQHHVACGGIVIAASHDPMGVEGLVMDMDQFQPSAAARDTIDEDWL